MSIDFMIFEVTFYDTLSAEFCKENVLSTPKKLENNCKMPLSDIRNHTSIFSATVNLSDHLYRNKVFLINFLLYSLSF